jgi:hypothetical protein
MAGFGKKDVTRRVETAVETGGITGGGIGGGITGDRESRRYFPDGEQSPEGGGREGGVPCKQGENSGYILNFGGCQIIATDQTGFEFTKVTGDFAQPLGAGELFEFIKR